MDDILKAPFPYFGGKRKATDIVWPRFGEVRNYVEPFCGSLAMLLGSPDGDRTETVNDMDGFIVNFWRSIKADPEAVAHWADYPVIEADLEARHAWLFNRAERLRWCLEDPDWFDAKIAGWWVWGACAWIGSGWCNFWGPHQSNGAHFVKGEPGSGITRKLPDLSKGRGINRQLPFLGNAGLGINRQLPTRGMTRLDFILDWFNRLSARLRDVRVACGDWKRITTRSVTTVHGLTAVFLDPPYDSKDIDRTCYAHDSNVAKEVEAWCLENGNNDQLRIALCGYEGDYTLPGWDYVMGKAGGSGFRKVKANDSRERIWFSPHCLSVLTRDLL